MTTAMINIITWVGHAIISVWAYFHQEKLMHEEESNSSGSLDSREVLEKQTQPDDENSSAN